MATSFVFALRRWNMVAISNATLDRQALRGEWAAAELVFFQSLLIVESSSLARRLFYCGMT
jgi:hypothetical protein